MDSLNEILKKVNKKFGEAVAQVGVPQLSQAGTLSLGSPSLDFCLYNNLVEGKMIEFSGLESSGKTTTAFLVAANYIREEVKRNPSSPRKILFIDAECTADATWAYTSTGYDMNDQRVPTIYIQGAGQTAEEYFDIVIDCVKTGEIGLVIFDSLSMIVGQQTADASMEKKDMGGVAKVLGDFCKRSVGLFNRHKCTFIGINGLTENVSGYGDPLQTPGGKTWKRACTVRLRFKQGDFFNEDGDILMKKDAQNPAGHIIEMYVMKTKVCKWDRKLGFAHLNYARGIDLLQDTIDVATYFGLIDNSVMGSFKIIDPDTGAVMQDENGQEIKIRGKKNVKPFFETHIELWHKIYNIIYEKLSVREDPTVVAFEKMLNVNLEEKLGYALNSQDEV